MDLIIIEKIVDDGNEFVPKGFMSYWVGGTETIPEGWIQRGGIQEEEEDG